MSVSGLKAFEDIASVEYMWDVVVVEEWKSAASAC